MSHPIWSTGLQVRHQQPPALPEPRPDTDLHLEARAGKDAFVRVLGVDYSVPPAFARRRIGVRVSPSLVRLSCEGAEIAAHARSFLPADVVLDPDSPPGRARACQPGISRSGR